MLGDCRDRLRELEDCSVHSVVTDPPYELGFMGKSWDSTGVAYDVRVWEECLRVLKPGGHLLAFGGSRTYHRLAVAIEDAGFQIRDQIMWVYGSGFPKSLDVSKAIDKAAGAKREVIGQKLHAQKGVAISEHRGAVGGGAFGEARMGDVTAPATDAAKQWEGWGTALKPAHEPIVLARKPLDGTVAQNVLTHGVGGINIDGCRVGDTSGGRFPANFIHDGSDEVLELFPDTAGQSASRFFYCAKANKKDRNEGLDDFQPKRDADRIADDGVGGANPRNRSNTEKVNHHPTVKPTELMRYLCRLVTPPQGVVLDPFTGSGSTGKAALLEGFTFLGVEQSEEYLRIAQARIGGCGGS